MKGKNNTYKKKGRSAKHQLQPHDTFHTRNLRSKTKSGMQTTDGSDDKTRALCQQIQYPSGRAHHGCEKLMTGSPHEEVSMYDEEVESPGGYAQIDPLHLFYLTNKSSHPSDFFSAKKHSQELSKQTTNGSDDKTRAHCQQIQYPSSRAHREKLVTGSPHEEVSMYDEEVESPGGHAQIDPLHLFYPSNKSCHLSDFFSAKEHSQVRSKQTTDGSDDKIRALCQQIQYPSSRAHRGCEKLMTGSPHKEVSMYDEEVESALEYSGPTIAPTEQDDFLDSAMGAERLSSKDKDLWYEHVLAGGPDDPPLLDCATTAIQRPAAQHVSAPRSENGVDFESGRHCILLEGFGEEDKSLLESFSHEWLGTATTTTPDDCHNSGMGVARLPHEEAFGHDGVVPQVLNNPSIQESAPTDYPASSQGKYSPQEQAAAQHELLSGVTDNASMQKSLALGADDGPPPANERHSNDNESSCILRSIDIVCEQGAFSRTHNKEIYLNYLESLLAEYLATPRGVERTNLVRQIHLKLTKEDGRKFLKRDIKCENCRKKKERGRDGAGGRAGGCGCLWRHLSAPQTNTKKLKSEEELRIKAERDKIVDTFRYLEKQQASMPPTGTLR